MVSVGTILTLGIVGAISIGAYAVYRNADKLGGALSRGVEASVTNPLGQWADNLWSSIAQPSQNPSVPTSSSLAGQTVASVKGSTITIPKDTTVHPSGIVTSSTPPLLNLSPSEKTSASAALAANRLKTMQQNQAFAKSTEPKAGYYYFNVVGSKYDTQQYVSADFAKQLFSADPSKIFNPKGLTDITYIGKSALQQAGFTLFGKSKGYL